MPEEVGTVSIHAEVKRKFTQQEAIEVILHATKDGGLPLEDRVVLLCGVVREQQDQIAQEQQANAALAGALHGFRGLVCKAAWALAAVGVTAFADGCSVHGNGGCPRHGHRMYTPETVEALLELAAVDDAGYALVHGAAPQGGSRRDGAMFDA